MQTVGGYLKIMVKLARLIRDNGLRTTIRRVYVAFPNRTRAIIGYIKTYILQKNIKSSLNEILDSDYKFIVVFDVSFGWDKGLFQRPQQIAKALAKEGVLVFYSKNIFDNGRFDKAVVKLEDNLYYLDYKNPIIRRKVDKKLKILSCDKIYQVYSTNSDYTYNDLIKKLKHGYKVIYEYIDSIQLSNESFMKKRHFKILRDNQIGIVVTSDALDRELEYVDHKNRIKIQNGVDFAHWQIKRKDEYSEVISKEKGKITLGYFGALAPDWFDYDLIRYLSQNDRLDIIIIGPFMYRGPSGTDPMEYISTFLDKRNVTFIDAVPYYELPKYAQAFDVCMIPFRINEITIATSPIKLFEYFSLGKPVVTTDMPECIQFECVYHSNSYEIFNTLIEKAYSDSQNPCLRDKYFKIAMENSWSSKSKSMIDFMRGN